MRVTDILRSAGVIDVRWSDEYAMERGSIVHEITELFDKHDLVESSVGPVFTAYLAAWRKFRAEVNPEILAIEEHVTHPIYGYTGTLDRRLTIHGREGIGDIKTGSSAPHHALQLCGYALCFERPLARWNIYLEAGGYKIVERKERKDYDVWKACVTTADWKRQNGVTTERSDAE